MASKNLTIKNIVLGLFFLSSCINKPKKTGHKEMLVNILGVGTLTGDTTYLDFKLKFTKEEPSVDLTKLPDLEDNSGNSENNGVATQCTKNDKSSRASLKLSHCLDNLLPVRNQGPRGTCTVFAATFALEFLALKKNFFKLGVNFSEEFLNWATKRGIERNPPSYQEADTVNNRFDAYKVFGICNEQLAPYIYEADKEDGTTGPLVSEFDPAAEAKDAAQKNKGWGSAFLIKTWGDKSFALGAQARHLQMIRQSLSAGYPVIVSLKWPTGNNPAISTQNELQNPNDGIFAGHAVSLVGYNEEGKFFIRNQWGTGWGDGGYALVSEAYLINFLQEAIIFI